MLPPSCVPSFSCEAYVYLLLPCYNMLPAGSGASHLQPLLSFLHHEPYGSSRAAWDGAVAKPLEAAATAFATATAAAATPAAAAAPGGATNSRGLGAAGALLVAEWGRQQLLRLLGRVMIRSCKADLALLPPCYKKVSGFSR
jgi:hypothetical protein